MTAIDLDRLQYSQEVNRRNEQGIQGFLQFVNEQEALSNRVSVPDPQYFSESHEAAMEYAKAHQENEEEIPPTERAIAELKHFQQVAKEAKPEKLLGMIDTIAVCIEAIEDTIYKDELN